MADIPCDTCRVPDPPRVPWRERYDEVMGWVWMLVVLGVGSRVTHRLIAGK